MLSPEIRARLERLHRQRSSTSSEKADVADGSAPTPEGRATENSRGRHLTITKDIDSIWPSGAAWARQCRSRWLQEERPSADTHPELAEFRRSFPQQTVFLDLETCGFAGCTIFLAGLLHIRSDRLVLSQLWARNYSEEAALLTTLWRIVSAYKVLVTFNGKSFDWPQVHDRSTLHRIGRDCRDSPSQFGSLASGRGLTGELSSTDARPVLLHCDLLHHARRKWKRSLPDCRLQTLERYICGRRRTGDIPGREIPDVYHDYVRHGSSARVGRILHHNALDLITLVQLGIQLVPTIDTGCNSRSA